MPRRLILWSLFFSSYLPLFVLLGLRSVDRSNIMLVASGVLIVLGAAGTLIFLYTASHKEAGEFELLEVENRDPDVAGYAASYLLPFLTVFSARWQDIASLAAFIVLLGVVYVRSRLIYVNPTLALLGYRLWRVIPITAGAPVDPDRMPWPRFLLADTGEIWKGEKITAHRVTNDLLLFEGRTTDGDD